MNVKLSNGKVIPVEMHKVRIVQKVNLVPVRRRLEAIKEAGYNTFLLRTKDIFLGFMTDSSAGDRAARLRKSSRLWVPGASNSGFPGSCPRAH